MLSSPVPLRMRMLCIGGERGCLDGGGGEGGVRERKGDVRQAMQTLCRAGGASVKP